MGKKIQIWTDEQIAYMVVKQAEEWTYDKIAKGMVKRFGVKRTAANVGATFRRINNQEASTVPHKYTQEEIDFIHAMFHNGFKLQIILDAFKEQFKKNLSYRRYYYILKDKTPTMPELIVEKMAEKEMKPKKTSELVSTPATVYKAWHNDTASRKQCAKILKMKYADTDSTDLNSMIQDMYESNSMTKKEASEEIDKLTAKATGIIRAEAKSVPAEKPTIQSEWIDADDLDLLINFYDWSVDEARARFRLSYADIAGRLEVLLNSDNPDKITLVMKAAKVVKMNKAQRLEDAKNGPWKRWKKRKQAKKMAKKEREIANLEKKLKKMKGDDNE